MRRVLVGMLVVGFVMGLAQVSEASQLSHALGNIWTALWSPVPCLFNLGADLLASGSKFVTCVLGNLNPTNYVP